MRKILFSFGLLAAFLTTPSARAVDPLPPEIEKSSLEKRAAYWQRTSRESAELKQKVGQERYNAALVYKSALLNQAEERLQRAEAQLEAELRPAESVGVSAPGSSFGLYVMLLGILGGGGFIMHRQLTDADRPV